MEEAAVHPFAHNARVAGHNTHRVLREQRLSIKIPLFTWILHRGEAAGCC